MGILHATGDIRSVSLWLGHADVKTTEMYLRASPAEKLPGAKNSLMSLLNGNRGPRLMHLSALSV